MEFGGLLERDAERSVAVAALDHSLNGDGAALGFEAPPGVGKTSLLQALTEEARARGARVLSARGVELEHGLAFGVVGQLFAPALASAIGLERQRLLHGTARLAGPVLGLAPQSPNPDPSATALHGLYWLCANLCERHPHVLAIDDAHWADEASLRFLVHLRHRYAGLPLLLAVTARRAEPAGDRAILEEVLNDDAMRVCRPRPLSPAASATLVRRRLGDRASDALCEACHSATGGNPFLIGELALALRDDGIDPSSADAASVKLIGPRTVARSVLVRLSRQDADAVELARAVSIFSEGAELRHASALAGLCEQATARAADRLVDVDVLAPGGPLSFVHRVMRNAVYQDLPPACRALLHLRAARLLRAEGADPAEIAPHLLAIEPGTDPGAFGELLAAARIALTPAKADAALRLIERALSEPVSGPERARALHMRDIARMLAGHPSMLDDLRAAVAGTLRTDAALLRDLAGVLFSGGQAAEAVAVLDDAVAAAAGGDADLHARCVIDRARVLWSDDESSPRYVADMRALRVAERPEGLLEHAMAANKSAWEAWRCEDADRATDLARRGLRGDLLVADGPDAVQPLAFAGLALTLADRPSEGLAAIHAALERQETSGAESRLSYLHLVAGIIGIYRGDLVGAEYALRRARDHVCDQRRGSSDEAAILSLLAVVAVERSDQRAAQELLAGLATARTWVGLHVLAARGHVHLACGRPQQALDDLGAALSVARRRGLHHPLYPVGWRADLALAAAAVGDSQRARELAEADLARARRFGAPGALGSALRTAALVAGGERGLEHLSEAAATLAQSAARLLYAETLTDLGSALRRANRRVAARGPLHLAMDVARRCGSERLLQRASEEHGACGGRARRTFVTGVESLTPSERRIARLAARGFTNREIAQQLYVTVKTVEMHVSNALGKLGISSRRQLADMPGLTAREASAA